ncbi:MAG: response regulator [Proteobacteria bacterium]|nr:response regulator [Pseudomonadota bacterium]
MINTILIVDDSRIARMMLNNCILQYKEFEIFEAEDGKKAVEKYKELNPEVVFMDLTMPVLNGYEATKEIIGINKDAIIFVITADVQPKSVEKITEIGAFAVIKKPAEPESVRNALIKAEEKLEQRS